MKKQLIQEVNRQREIMGLSVLFEQDQLYNQSKSEFPGFISSHESNVLTMMEEMFGTKGRVDKNRNVFTFLNTIQDGLGRGMRKGLEFGHAETKLIDINILPSGEAKVINPTITSFKKGIERDLDQICKYINYWNRQNFGSQQVVGFGTQTDRPGVNTLEFQKTNKLGGVYVFSAKYVKIDYDETPGTDAIASTPDTYIDVAGIKLDPIDMSDAFIDFAVEPNKADLQNAQAELDKIAQAGGEITRIAISSTATATGISEKGEETFVNTMNSTGFPKYAQITNFAKDTDLGEFSEMEVTSADRALAVARGKYLAKQLGFDDSQVDYTFSLVQGVPGGGGKIVNLQVISQTPDSQEIDVRGTPGKSATNARGGETFTSTDTGAQAKITRGHIVIQKRSKS